jgi:transposase
MRGIPFDVKLYIEAVESYVSGKKKVDEIVTETGIAESSFFNKLKEYREKGGRIDPPRRRGKSLKRTDEFKSALAELKKEHPAYGCDRLTRELAKNGYAVSDDTTTRALRDLNLQFPPKRGASSMQRSSGDHRPKKRL